MDREEFVAWLTLLGFQSNIGGPKSYIGYVCFPGTADAIIVRVHKSQDQVVITNRSGRRRRTGTARALKTIKRLLKEKENRDT